MSGKENGKVRHLLAKTMAFATGLTAILSMTSCGLSEEQSGPEFIYVPEYVEMEAENGSFYDMQYVDGGLYYTGYVYDENGSSQNITRVALEDQSTTVIPVVSKDDNSNINNFCVGEDGSVYVLLYDYSDYQAESGESGLAMATGDGSSDTRRMILRRYDAQGQQIFETQVQLPEEAGGYIQYMAVDGQGRVYLGVDSKVAFCDENGAYQGLADMGDWIGAMGRGRDGKMYVRYYSGESGGEFGGYVLAEMDYDKKAAGTTYANFKDGNSGGSLSAGTEYDFLISDGISLYGYDLSAQESVKLFDWLDSDINGDSVQGVAQLEDGRILAIVSDWQTGESSIALMTKTKASELPQKEQIVIATMYASDLTAAAVRFNKNSDQYHISVKQYVDFDSDSEDPWADALTNLNNDITSSHCPDIINLNGLNVSWLASKGVLEDLTPYLESSGTVNKDDLLESVLNAFTYSDKLVSIPAAFSLQTVIGSGADLGDREGWSVEDMIAYADAHPDAQLFNYSSKENILQMCMMFGEDAFVNWESGECKFDTPEFKAILEFVNRFPDEFQYEDGQASAPTRLQNGEILLDTCGIYDFGEVQMYEEIFKGDYTCIGYPTVDGSSGTVLNVSSDMAITTKSDHKDGAWSFIESYLTADEPNPGWSFPNSKERLQKMAEEAVKVEYATDENGDILTDENGEPILSGGSSSVMYEDGWSYEYRQPTQEEVDLILGLIDKAKPANVGGDDEISKIISEEAAAYWQGQKSVDEVAKIIQNRIQTYVDENR